MPILDARQLPEVEKRPGWFGRIFSSKTMTFADWRFVAGAEIHEHSHPQEEVWQVLEGELTVTIDGATEIAGPGMVAIVPANARHSVVARSDGRALVADHPSRPDF